MINAATLSFRAAMARAVQRLRGRRPAQRPAWTTVTRASMRCTCGGGLDVDPATQVLLCTRCATAYPVDDGIASFIPDGARTALDDIDYDAVYRIDAAASMAFAQSYIELLGERLPSPVGNFMEVGAGTGQFTLGFMHLAQPRHALVTDISVSMLKACRGRLLSNGIAADRVAFAAWDGADCLKPDSQDVIAGFSVLHHVLDFQTMLARLRRSLRPGGIAVFLEPNYRFHLAMVDMVCEILVAVEGSAEWTAKDRQHLADWLYENNTNLRFRGDERMLAGREDKHMFDGGQMRTAARAAGFDTVELLAAEDETFSALEVYSRQMRLAEPARQDLLARYARMLPGAFGHVASEDLAASTILVLGRNGPGVPATPPLRNEVARHGAVPEYHRGPRCDLAIRCIDVPAVDNAPVAQALQCQGWVLGDVEIRYVVLSQHDRRWLFPVHRHRADVHSALNAFRDYPLRQSLFSGVDHQAPAGDLPDAGPLHLALIAQDDHHIQLGTLDFDPASREPLAWGA